MKTKSAVLHSLQKWLSLTLPVGILALGTPLPAVHAGAPGVFLNDQTYFTVEQVLLSSGGDSSTLQFALKLQNGADTAVNMNDYGVRVTDTNGYSYPAQLSAKGSAQVSTGQSTVFRYTSKVPAGDTLDQLQVDIFRWDDSQADLMDDLGALPVSQSAEGEPVKETVIRADEIDGTLPSDTEINIQLGKSYLVHENNEVHLYTDLYAVNNGFTGFQLPAGLKYRISGTRGDSYTASAVSGTDAALLPKDKRKITLRASVPASVQSVDGYGLQFYTENQGNTAILGGLNLSGSASASKIGENQPYFGKNGATDIAFTTVSTLASNQSDGLHLYSTVEVRNNGTELAAVPPLSASYQFGTDGSVIAAADDNQAAYIAGKSSAYYYFNAVVPSGLQPGDVKLVLLGREGTAAASQSSAASTVSNSTKTANAASTTAANDTTANKPITNGTSSSGNGSGSGGTSDTAVQTVPLSVTALNGATDSSNLIAVAKDYNIGDPLALESGVLNSDLELSLVEFHVGKNDESDFQTGIAKFKITNKGKSTLDLPSFNTGLVSDGGAIYTGSRQSSAAQQISPNTSYVVSYSYLLPDNVSSDNLALNVSGSKGAVSIGTFKAVPQSIELGREFQLYPYHVTLNSTTLQWSYSSGKYNLQLSLDATVKRTDQVLIDSNFSPLGLELVDPLGRVVTTASVPFTGEQRLVSGTQIIKFGSLTSDEFNSGLTLRLFETVTTPYGTAKRIIKEIPNP